jgi:rhombotail lipoprotein
MHIPRIILLLVTTQLLGGCSALWLGGDTRQGNSSSLVDFLYPDGQKPAGVPEQMPYLQLPIRVGIAFVPGKSYQAIPADEQELLLQRVANAFRDRPYVSAIEVIPDSYLRTAKGFQGMSQVAAMFNVDVMALVSYDQIALSEERDSSLLYWTIVGALVVKGNTNEVQTMIDTAVFDVSSSKLLFRAPGTHRDTENATLMDASRDLRHLRSNSYTMATDDMIVNLNHQLEQFREAVKRGERAEVEWKPGSSGGGSYDHLALIALFLLLLMRGARHWTAMRTAAASNRRQ